MGDSLPLPVLEARELAVSFAGQADMPRVAAVSNASWGVHAGQMLAIVGESGSGKSVSALAAMGLLAPAARVDRGSIVLRVEGEERDLLRSSAEEWRSVRGRHLAMIFQEPMTSLNPVLSIEEQLLEVIRLHQRLSREQAVNVAIDALRAVKMTEPESRLKQYPHELSGGMRQRVMIAMAIACQPAALLADEPTTALDVTVQAHILDLLAELRTQRKMAVVLITHDLGVVADHADVVCVMFGGRVVEFGATKPVLRQPMHPYTKALLACRPRFDRRIPRLATVGDIISPSAAEPVKIEDGQAVVPWWPFSKPPDGMDPETTPVLVPVGNSVNVHDHSARWIAAWPCEVALRNATQHTPHLVPVGQPCTQA